MLGYNVKPLCERCPTFRMNAVPSPVKLCDLPRDCCLFNSLAST